MIRGINNYEINDNIIGKGSFSTVFSGKKIETEELVAIKKIAKNSLSELKLHAVRNEIEIIKILIKNPHDSVVKFYEVIENNLNIYIVMELCDSTLSSILVRPMKESYSKFYYYQILSALNHLQSLNIIHRDIKPDNILLKNNNLSLKICDFSLSIIKKSNRKINDISCGSILYMSPEMINNEKYDERTDVWSSGIILYQMVYGKHPYDGIIRTEDIKNNINNFILNRYDSDNDIDNNGFNLLEKTLNRSKKNILKSNKLLNHRWFSNLDNNLRINKLSDLFIVKKEKCLSKSLPKNYYSRNLMEKNINRSLSEYSSDDKYENNENNKNNINPKFNVVNASEILVTGTFKKYMEEYEDFSKIIVSDN